MVELDQSIAGGGIAGRADREVDDAERQRTLEEINRALVQQGVKLHPYPKDVMAAALKAANELYDDEAAANPVFRCFYQSWTVFRYAQYQWYRIAEGSFSNFMAGQRLPFK
jgi:TRAP-type mannitol/chloroaromatic compound transport system substrate-binding protein